VALLLGPSPSRLGRLADHVRGDAAASGVSAWWAWSLITLPFVGGALIAVTWLHWPLFTWFLQEDHPIEWLQFAMCMITALIAAMAAVGYGRRGRWLIAVVFAVLALGAFVLGAEEISWGQRVFSIATPAEIAAKNDQEELNIHNLTGAGIDIAELFKIAELIIGFGGALLPLLTRFHPLRVRSALLRAVSPPLFLVPAFAFAGAYRALRFALMLAGSNPDAAVLYTEWAELCLYIGLAGLAITAYVPTVRRRGGRHAAAAGTGEELPSSPVTGGVLAVVALVGLTTVALALMSLFSSVKPGNV
jgi:hypothetical protein